MTETLPPSSQRARTLVTKFLRAAKDHAWRGSQRPEDHPALDKRFNDARNALLSYIGGLEGATAPGAPAPSDERQQFAVNLRGNWYIATKTPATAYGDLLRQHGDKLVWSEYPSTSLLGDVGEENLSIILPQTPL